MHSFEPPTSRQLQKHFDPTQLEILQLIGRGGMGAVYLARQPRLDRRVAIKILPPEMATQPGFDDRFAREAQVLARLKHPHIVDVYDYGRAGPYSYLMLEYVEGANLREMQEQGRASVAEALMIIPQLCEALQFAHDAGVVHRDIKPENILLDARGNVKVMDFGLAKLADAPMADRRLTGTRQVMGTLHYMAPEQYERPREVDHRADIFALGVVFYELLTGELPLGRFDPPSVLLGTDANLDNVVMRSLEKEPSRRYPRAADLQSDVLRFAGMPRPITKPPVRSVAAPAPVVSLEHWLGSVNLLVLIVFVFNVIAALGVTLALTSRTDDDALLFLINTGALSIALSHWAVRVRQRAELPLAIDWLMTPMVWLAKPVDSFEKLLNRFVSDGTVSPILIGTGWLFQGLAVMFLLLSARRDDWISVAICMTMLAWIVGRLAMPRDTSRLSYAERAVFYPLCVPALPIIVVAAVLLPSMIFVAMIFESR
ncbi:MAG: serine/threonine protein kinase, partial [Planctomycetales bacterium]|nr:serine/threonine protein kinase [Planctomycetales bacterium]